MAELLGVRILQGFDRHRRLGPGFPLDATLIHHGGLYSDSVSAQDGEIQQELGAEVVIVGLHPLLNLISFSVEWNLKGEKCEKKINMNINRAATQTQFIKNATNASTVQTSEAA